MFEAKLPENLEEIPPGPELAKVLAELDWECLSDHDLIRALQAQNRQIAHYQAGHAWTINRVAERYQEGHREHSFEYDDAAKGAAVEIGAALHLTKGSAEAETVFSIELLRHRLRVFEALLLGLVDRRRVRVLVDCTQHVSDAVADTSPSC